MSVLDRLKKGSTIKDSSILAKSQFFTEKDMIQTDVPMVNVALSGNLDGGLTPGLTMFAGPSKHFKTAFALLMASAYMKKYPDAVVLFYDSEFGTPQAYFDTFNIDTDRVLHTPITDVEQLKHDIMVQMQEIGKEDKVIISPTQGAQDNIPAEELQYLQEMAVELIAMCEQGDPKEAWVKLESENLDSEQKVALWTLLPSKVRTALKKAKEI